VRACACVRVGVCVCVCVSGGGSGRAIRTPLSNKHAREVGM